MYLCGRRLNISCTVVSSRHRAHVNVKIRECRSASKWRSTTEGDDLLEFDDQISSLKGEKELRPGHHAGTICDYLRKRVRMAIVHGNGEEIGRGRGAPAVAMYKHRQCWPRTVEYVHSVQIGCVKEFGGGSVVVGDFTI